ncbi:dihydrofolate reductase [Kurthia huakuii]|uniref:dihydrofolate reductase n=1 Tax=Kurthia huakuii TaxID=1421019 RepID=UPI00049629AF|nr:dihydrofolate reductase [Kurthia huakuii]MBM7700088.1 dihydrofolate reductase [Kurthia huakuii]
MISLIVAHDENRVIGYENDMPWHLPGDLAYFKRTTMGKPIIMGRKTFESIGRALPGRLNIVITRNSDYAAEGITTVSNLSQAIELAKKEHAEIMIIGGGQIFVEALPLAERLYITEIHHQFPGDTYFPAYADWHEVSSSEPQQADGYTFDYKIFEK